MHLVRPALLAAFAGLVGATSACYVSSPAYDCYYYYGYSYPYCDYGYYGYYAPSDEYSTMAYTAVDVEETPHPDPTVAPTTPDSTVNVTSYSYLAHDSETPEEAAANTDDEPDLDSFDDRYPCNTVKDEILTLCARDDQPFDPEAQYIVIAFELENPLPTDDATNFFVLTFAFDSDNDPTNNYDPPDELANDYAGATDKWITASYNPDTGWQVRAFEWNGTHGIDVETDARVILEGRSAALVIPNTEFETPIPGNRIAVFRHTGDEGANGDWSGLVYPPLGAPLAGP